MIKLNGNGVYLVDGNELLEDTPEHQGRIAELCPRGKDEARRGTITYGILAAHNTGLIAGGGNPTGSALHLNFDAMTSHDITYVNIVQTAKVSGLEEFPVPYILTNCHNSLCAVGGTINEDDHVFGLSAAKRYGGVYVPPHLAVMHSYIREACAGCGKMILGSDSHTRYGALGTMGVGEGGGELAKQLLRQTYDIAYPKVIAVRLNGKVRNGVGPQDAALAIIGAVFKNGFVKNAALEFVGGGIAALPLDFRAGIDVMTTETTCWSSIWQTDDAVREFLTLHGRAGDYRKLSPAGIAYYDGAIDIDLSAIKPMIALPFHPSNICEIDALLENPKDILREVEKNSEGLLENPAVKLHLVDKVDGEGRVRIDQGIIAGCAGGTYDNIMAASAILASKALKAREDNKAFSLSIYPGSQPVFLELSKNGAAASLIANGAVIRTAFCGPCFGAGDVPSNNGLSIRHTTRNFPNREGSKPSAGQIASVALMDARSVAATALNGGYLYSAESLGIEEKRTPYHYDEAPYKARIFNGVGKADRNAALQYGPNIVDWPEFEALGDSLLLKVVSYITDPVTTTDELIPSGETSSFRSNPVGLAEFTLSRKDPEYVGLAKAVLRAEGERLKSNRAGMEKELPELPSVLEKIHGIAGCEGLELVDIQTASAIFANKPGDGSAREQAASCQRVLGGAANFAHEYATKRYRSNLINWGLLPFTLEGEPFKKGDYVFIPGVRRKIADREPSLTAYILSVNGKDAPPEIPALELKTPELTNDEREIILAGCLINYNRNRMRNSKG
ncbi:MAG: hydratase [Treponema sp.]|jgi:aconitate hydratase|nr:hydratase [Treponema sp.]